MKRIVLPFVAVAFVVACSPDQPSPVGLRVQSPAFSVAAANGGAGTFLVRFKGNAIPDNFSAKVASLGGEVIFAHAGVGIAAVSGLTDEGADALAAVSTIAAVDPDAYTTIEEPASVEQFADEAVESQSNPAGAANFSLQWNMRAISAPAAWTAGYRGVSTVKVGILDTGIDYRSGDLYGNVDLALSKSFLSAAENARVQTAFPGAHEIADLHYHGTHVAATASSMAIFNAGVASTVKLVGLKVCAPGSAPNFNGSCPTSGVLAAILYAADNGLDVINMSLGGTFNRRDASARGGFGPSFIATINSVFNYAHKAGMTVVVSAGNGNPATGIGYDLDHDGNGYKAYCSAPHVICVAATGPTGGSAVAPLNVDALAGYSNYGRSAITVAAPGGNFLRVRAVCSGFTIVTPFLICRTRTAFPATGTVRSFSLLMSGTSMASPHVAGLAGIIAGQVGRNPSAISGRISNSADQLGLGGNSAQYGAGRINVARAVGAQ